MATYKGDDGTLTIGALTAQVKSFEVTTEAGIIEDTSKGDAWKTNKAGRKGWKASASFHLAGSEPVEGATVACTFDFGDGTSWEGSGIVASVNRTSPEGDSIAEYTVEITGNGALAVGI